MTMMAPVSSIGKSAFVRQFPRPPDF